MNHSFHGKTAALEETLAPLFSKLPHLPHDARMVLINIAPWLALIFGVLGLLGVVSALSTMPYLFANPFVAAALGGSYMPLMLALIVTGIASVLDLMAWRPLAAHKKQGWNYLFYATMLSTLSSLINMVFGYTGFAWLVGSLIGFWLLFEIRSHYNS